MKPLTVADMEILEFARTSWKYDGAKTQAIRERFACQGPDPLTWFHQRLNPLLSNPAAEVYDPDLVRRLRRLRDARAAQNFRRPIGASW